MPIFQRTLLKELLQNALMTFAVITLIFLVGGSLRVLHKSEFLTLQTFLQAVLFFVGTNLDKTLPMTVLISVVLTYGRASAENELNTMRASGIHLYTAWVPALLFGLLGSAVVLHVNDRIAPRLSFTKSALLEAGLDSVIDAMMERGGNAIELSDDVHVIWRGVDELDRLRDVRIKRYSKGDDDDARPLEDEIMAETARLEPDKRRGLLKFHCDGVRFLYGKNKGAEMGSITYGIPLRDEVIEKKPSHHTLSELVQAEGRIYDDAPKPRKIETELHKRVAGAFACLLFVLIGMPLAVIFRHGNRMVAFLIAFLIAIVVYYPTFILGEVLADETDLSPFLAIWSGSIALFVLGVGLTVVIFRR
ncbi:MAG: LptF/LptG family permease [Planctomycetota bacterium JB042]